MKRTESRLKNDDPSHDHVKVYSLLQYLYIYHRAGMTVNATRVGTRPSISDHPRNVHDICIIRAMILARLDYSLLRIAQLIHNATIPIINSYNACFA